MATTLPVWRPCLLKQGEVVRGGSVDGFLRDFQRHVENIAKRADLMQNIAGMAVSHLSVAVLVILLDQVIDGFIVGT